MPEQISCLTLLVRMWRASWYHIQWCSESKPDLNFPSRWSFLCCRHYWAFTSTCCSRCVHVRITCPLVWDGAVASLALQVYFWQNQLPESGEKKSSVLNLWIPSLNMNSLKLTHISFNVLSRGSDNTSRQDNTPFRVFFFMCLMCFWIHCYCAEN